MELRQLQYLVAVAEEASFTRAAAKAHVAQPGVSAQIRRLERELGQPLLDRSGGTVRLTEAGTAVIPYARAALGAVAALRQTADALVGLVRGHVTVGAVASILTPRVDLPGLLAAFHRDHPGIDITLSEAASDQLIEALRGGRIDVAFAGVATTSALPDDVAAQVVATEPLVVAVGDSHPLARRKTVTLRELRSHVLISFPVGSGVRARLDEACAALGFRPSVAFEAADPRMLAQLAGKGLGAAVVPASAAVVPAPSAYRDALHVLSLTSPPMQAHIALTWRAGEPVSPATRAFLRHAQRVLSPP